MALIIFCLIVLLGLALLLDNHQDGPVDLVKLPGPRGIVQKRAQVEPIVIRAVRLCVIRRREGRHLVAVDRVIKEETLDLDSNLR